MLEYNSLNLQQNIFFPWDILLVSFWCQNVKRSLIEETELNSNSDWENFFPQMYLPLVTGIATAISLFSSWPCFYIFAETNVNLYYYCEIFVHSNVINEIKIMPGVHIMVGTICRDLHCNKSWSKWSSPLENCSTGNGKAPVYKMFRHQQGAFPFPELQFSRTELNISYFCFVIQGNRWKTLQRFAALLTRISHPPVNT